MKFCSKTVCTLVNWYFQAFRCPVMVRNSNHGLNIIQFNWYADHGLNNEPSGDCANYHHLNIRLAHYSDLHYSLCVKDNI